MIPVEPAGVSFPVFGTTGHLLVTAPAALADAEALVRRELDAVDAACSRFRADSELSAVNAAAGRPVTVGPLLAEALQAAWEAAASTAGLVDPTVGTAVRALGYDRSFASLRPELLDAADPAGRRPAAGLHAVAWDPVRRLLQLPAGVALDLGATAKAWAADRTALLAARATGSGVLVNLGGDLAVAGPAPEGGWRVSVAEDHREVHHGHPVVSVHAGGLATSGTTVRRWNRGQRPVHHIVDPRSGDNPPEHWRTVSVAGRSCAEANAAATAAVVLGPDALVMLRQRGLPARLVDRLGEVAHVCGWPADAHRAGAA